MQDVWHLTKKFSKQRLTSASYCGKLVQENFLHLTNINHELEWQAESPAQVTRLDNLVKWYNKMLEVKIFKTCRQESLYSKEQESEWDRISSQQSWITNSNLDYTP
jgi:hypothetical protein